MLEILSDKYYLEDSVFRPDNLLREARRQKNLPECEVPSICVLDPDGDLAEYLKRTGQATKNKCWACYHSELFTFDLDGWHIGIIPCVVGAPYAVLVAEQLAVSGCRFIISITSAGIINEPMTEKRFALIIEAIRDEGTSYHYVPAGEKAMLAAPLAVVLHKLISDSACPFFEGISWTTDAPYRETPSAIQNRKQTNITCVEMEASALYSFAKVRNHHVICFAHLTNKMAQREGDFEKGIEMGSIDSLSLINYLLPAIKDL